MKFWKNKNILITGFEGFLGSNLTKRLISYGANIVGLDIKVRRKHTILTEDDYKKIVVVKGNVTNYSLLKKIILKYRIQYVFHLAAEALVGSCESKPLRAFSSNIKGTWGLLEACRTTSGVQVIIIASSDKAYGSHKKLPYKEDAPLVGRHPYDVSKSCADLIAYTYYNTYKVPVAVTRCGNIFGPGDFNFSRIIPDAIRCAVSDKCLMIRSDGKFIRDYVYVDDIVDGYIMLAEQLQKKSLLGESFNFSDENPLAVLDLVKNIYKLLNKKPKYKVLNEANYEIVHQYLDSSKARKILGWKPRVLFELGLKKTIDWYDDFFNDG